VSLAKITMHNREYLVLLRPGKNGLVLHTMFYRDEVRAIEEFRTDTSQVKDKELELAISLVETLAASFEPEKYKDSFRDNLKAMIEAKVQGEEVVEPPAAEKMAPVIDIMEALKKSLAAAKKPPASETEPARAAEELKATGTETGKRRRTRRGGGG
jgi:DNA end-binding protein Ku